MRFVSGISGPPRGPIADESGSAGWAGAPPATAGLLGLRPQLGGAHHGTPFGSTRAWPVVADETVAGRTISLGAGEHGLAVTVAGSDVVRALDARLADVTDPLG